MVLRKIIRFTATKTPARLRQTRAVKRNPAIDTEIKCILAFKYNMREHRKRLWEHGTIVGRDAISCKHLVRRFRRVMRVSGTSWAGSPLLKPLEIEFNLAELRMVALRDRLEQAEAAIKRTRMFLTDFQTFHAKNSAKSKPEDYEALTASIAEEELKLFQKLHNLPPFDETEQTGVIEKVAKIDESWERRYNEEAEAIEKRRRQAKLGQGSILLDSEPDYNLKTAVKLDELQTDYLRPRKPNSPKLSLFETDEGYKGDEAEVKDRVNPKVSKEVNGFHRDLPHQLLNLDSGTLKPPEVSSLKTEDAFKAAKDRVEKNAAEEANDFLKYFPTSSTEFKTSKPPDSFSSELEEAFEAAEDRVQKNAAEEANDFLKDFPDYSPPPGIKKSLDSFLSISDEANEAEDSSIGKMDAEFEKWYKVDGSGAPRDRVQKDDARNNKMGPLPAGDDEVKQFLKDFPEYITHSPTPNTRGANLWSNSDEEEAVWEEWQKAENYETRKYAARNDGVESDEVNTKADERVEMDGFLKDFPGYNPKAKTLVYSASSVSEQKSEGEKWEEWYKDEDGEEKKDAVQNNPVKKEKVESFTSDK